MGRLNFSKTFPKPEKIPSDFEKTTYAVFCMEIVNLVKEQNQIVKIIDINFREAKMEIPEKIKVEGKDGKLIDAEIKEKKDCIVWTSTIETTILKKQNKRVKEIDLTLKQPENQKPSRNKPLKDVKTRVENKKIEEV